MTEQNQKDIKTNTELLIQTSQNGHFSEVQRLIPISNPKANNSLALTRAVVNEHIDIVKLLIPVSDYHLVLKNLIKKYVAFGIIAPFQQCIEEYEVVLLKERLTTNIQNIQNNKSPTPTFKRKI